MKKITNFVAAITITGLAVFTGCTKSSSSSGYYMKATINGVPFSANECYAGLAITGTDSVWTIMGGNFSSPSAAFTTYPQIDLDLNSQNYKGIGTYTLGLTTIGIECSLDSSGTSSVASSSAIYGTVTITTTTPALTGTFSFTCADSTKVTNGSFIAQGQ